MDTQSSNCELCHAAESRYTCPKCNLRYCSVACYKAPNHIKCSEEFFRSCIQDELASAETNSQEDMKKIYDILKRMREVDAGLDHNFEDQLDSDDDENEEKPTDADDDADEDELEDMATRLQDVDLNNADEVWEHLSASERAEFQKMIETGEINKLIPNYKPWWIKPKESKIVEIDASTSKQETSNEPKIMQNIPKFSDIFKKEPSPCVHYNLWNIMAAYTCVVRFFSGEQLTTPIESATHLVNLSATLKYGTNFEDTEDAIISVEAEALSTGNGTAAAASLSSLYVESREQLKNDARLIMSTTKHKLMALSDILQLFQLSKVHIKNLRGEEAAFQKIFALSNGCIELNRTKLNQFIKRTESFLAFVNRELGGVSH